MRIFCTIMLIVFLTASVGMTVGCIVEWQGRCSGCEEPHADTCNVLMRSRVFSIIATLVLWVCAFLWVSLLVDKIKEDHMYLMENKIRTTGDYQLNMRNSMERKQW
jgi:formate hydrogenlyase subunit 3/multisubunit Na+/H+ antiporter MnhD subunit